jgi:hypothetical protein
VSKAVKINIYKMMVKPAVVFGSGTVAMAVMDMTSRYVGEENMMKDVWTGGRARNVGNMN